MNLTDEQQRFVDEYLVDLNATQAAIRAGCSSEEASAVGHEYLKNWRITDQISEAIQSRVKRVAVSQDYVIEKIVDTIERSLGYPAFEESGSSWLVDGKRRKFDATSVLKACDLLGKHLGMFRERAAGLDKDGLCDMCRSTRDLSNDELGARLVAMLVPPVSP